MELHGLPLSSFKRQGLIPAPFDRGDSGERDSARARLGRYRHHIANAVANNGESPVVKVRDQNGVSLLAPGKQPVIFVYHLENHGIFIDVEPPVLSALPAKDEALGKAVRVEDLGAPGGVKPLTKA